MVRRSVSLGVVLVFVASLAGCPAGGAKPVPAKGKVLLNDQPVAGATVTFSPKTTGQGNMATGTTDSNGEFSLASGTAPGALPGEYRVAVSKTSGGMAVEGGAKPEDMMKMMKDKMGPTGKPKPSAKPKSELPEKYANPDTSGLSFTVTTDAAKNVFEIKLTE